MYQKCRSVLGCRPLFTMQCIIDNAQSGPSNTEQYVKNDIDCKLEQQEQVQKIETVSQEQVQVQKIETVSQVQVQKIETVKNN